MRPIFVLSHGAGAPSSSAWMQAWRDLLGTVCEVHAFDYPYMARGLKRPDRFHYILFKGNRTSWLVWGAWILMAYGLAAVVWIVVPHP